MNIDNKEIERRWKVGRMPEIESNFIIFSLRQGYMAYGPKSSARIRAIKNITDPNIVPEYTLTIKRGSGLSRSENEIYITEDQFMGLWVTTEGIRIEKNRVLIPLGSTHIAELDLFGGNLEGLDLVEVEFRSLEDAHSFTPPDWFGQEVTKDERYTNLGLALSGKIPKDSVYGS